MVLEEAIYHKTLCTGLRSLTVHHCKLEGDVKHSQDTTKNSPTSLPMRMSYKVKCAHMCDIGVITVRKGKHDLSLRHAMSQCRTINNHKPRGLCKAEVTVTDHFIACIVHSYHSHLGNAACVGRNLA